MKKILLLLMLLPFLGMSQTITRAEYEQHIVKLDKGYNYKKYPHIETYAKIGYQGGNQSELEVVDPPQPGYVRFIVMNPAAPRNRTYVYQERGGGFLDVGNPDHTILRDTGLNKMFIQGCANEVVDYIDFKLSDYNHSQLDSSIFGTQVPDGYGVVDHDRNFSHIEVDSGLTACQQEIKEKYPAMYKEYLRTHNLSAFKPIKFSEGGPRYRDVKKCISEKTFVGRNIVPLAAGLLVGAVGTYVLTQSGGGDGGGGAPLPNEPHPPHTEPGAQGVMISIGF